MNDERIPKKALQQIIYGKRAVGKPRKKWEDAIQRTLLNYLEQKH
jgi:hypothetical protein